MIEFNIDLGLRELYSLSNFSFDIINTGSADLQVEDINISSENIQLSYIKTPFIIMLDTAFSLFGYLKILNKGNSFQKDYIDFEVSYITEENEKIYDTYRYYLNYESQFYNIYTQYIKIKNINYINNMLLLYIDSDIAILNDLKVILVSADNVQYYVFPKKYKISDKKVVYIYDDNIIKNTVINSDITFFITSDINNLEIKQLSYRSI
jgi:hypothetical protein